LVPDAYGGVNARYSAGSATGTHTRNAVAFRDYWSGGSRLVEEKAINTVRGCYRKDKNGLWLKGVLLEPQVENLLKYSTDYTDASWTKTRMSIDNAPTVTLPNNTTSGYHILHEAAAGEGNGLHRIQRTVPFSLNVKYVFQAWLRTINKPWARLRLDTTGPDPYCYFNVFTGAAGTSANIDNYGIIPWGNFWYLVWMGWTHPDAGIGISRPVEVGVCDSDGDATFTGADQDSIYCFNPMVFAGTYPTSLIETVAASVVRTTDSSILYAGGSNIGGKDNQQGTIVFDILEPIHTPNAAINLWQMSDGGSSADMLKAYIDTDGYLNVTSRASAGTDGDIAFGSSICSDEKKRVQISWKPNYLATIIHDYKTGKTVGQDRSCTIPNDIDKWEIMLAAPGITGNHQHLPNFERTLVRKDMVL